MLNELLHAKEKLKSSSNKIVVPMTSSQFEEFKILIKEEYGIEQDDELYKIMRDEYGIEISGFKNPEPVLFSQEFKKKPALEFCGTPPDGKSRRRERRRQERILKHKNKIL